MKYTLMSGEEIQTVRRRLAAITAAAALFFLILIGRLWYLQVLNGEYYDDLARGNRIRVIPEEAPRGMVYDRNGVLLALNRPAFNVQLIPEDTPDLNHTLKNLSLLTEVPQQQFETTVQANRSHLKFKPVVIMKDIGRKSADLIDTYQEDIPGISVTIEAKRLYPAAYLSSHVLGYVGLINEQQLRALPLKKLLSGRIVGQSGIERMLNEILIGDDGGRQIEVDNVGRELRVINQPVKPVPGNDITLTIDLRLQRYVRTLMAGKSGVIIVMKPRTGEIISLSSFPDYDPNQFVGGIGERNWEKLTSGEGHPLINKATQGLYPPGSTFKMVLALAGLDLGIIDRETTFDCPGYFRLNREISYCWNRAGHGEVNVIEAIAESCNVFFYKLGLEVGVDQIRRYALMLGFGRPTGVELESEKAGLLPSRDWKMRVIGEKWYDGETIPVAIGQGFVSVTPLQILNYVNTIANRGVWVKPTLLRRAVSPDGTLLFSEESLPRKTRLLDIPEVYFDIVREGMVNAVYGEGTAFRARIEKFTVAGKTGTSQVIGRGTKPVNLDKLDEKFLPHSFFVGYAPAESPQVSLIVLVEHGGAGSKVAAPMGKKILEFYWNTIESFEAEIPNFPKKNRRRRRFQRALERAFEPPAPKEEAGTPAASGE